MQIKHLSLRPPPHPPPHARAHMYNCVSRRSCWHLLGASTAQFRDCAILTITIRVVYKCLCENGRDNPKKGRYHCPSAVALGSVGTSSRSPGSFPNCLLGKSCHSGDRGYIRLRTQPHQDTLEHWFHSLPFQQLRSRSRRRCRSHSRSPHHTRCPCRCRQSLSSSWS
jgi:hypothetical protein